MDIPIQNSHGTWIMKIYDKFPLTAGNPVPNELPDKGMRLNPSRKHIGLRAGGLRGHENGFRATI